ncbi:hypothetical protein [Frankia sp. Cas3]|uniref:alpha/beta fold hydrolase n=1 Tax=Frankia sp. Cas3 TaxID=3073926 RepID=UPI002AD351F0|nr:hypothetical protein [Frankia sp. Cas3]
MMTPLVLVHGGGFDSRCWDLLVPHLAAPVPQAGTSARQALRPDVQEHVEESQAERRETMDPAQVKRYFGSDLDAGHMCMIS